MPQCNVTLQTFFFFFCTIWPIKLFNFTATSLSHISRGSGRLSWRYRRALTVHPPTAGGTRYGNVTHAHVVHVRADIGLQTVTHMTAACVWAPSLHQHRPSWSRHIHTSRCESAEPVFTHTHTHTHVHVLTYMYMQDIHINTHTHTHYSNHLQYGESKAHKSGSVATSINTYTCPSYTQWYANNAHTVLIMHTPCYNAHTVLIMHTPCYNAHTML